MGPAVEDSCSVRASTSADSDLSGVGMMAWLIGTTDFLMLGTGVLSGADCPRASSRSASVVGIA